MKVHFDNLRATRNKMLYFVETASYAYLNTVPSGFSNNIFWNIAHVVVTQQLLTYRLSGKYGYLEQSFIDRFKKGTKVEEVYGKEDLEIVKDNLFALVDRTETEYNNNVFTFFKEYETSYGITLNSIEDALIFNNMHEALHLGYIMAMRKSIAV